MAAKISEADFQRQVIELAEICGWRVLHIRKSIKGAKGGWTTTTSISGWPDLMIMRPPDGLIFAELKVKPNRTSDSQDEVLAYLARFPFARSVVWFPEDWDAIQETLARRR